MTRDQSLDPSPWPYGWMAFGAACSAVVIGLLWLG